MVNIQAQMKELFGNSCYAYCLARLFLKTDDIKTLTKYVLEAWWMNYIDYDGYVSKPLPYITMLCGKHYRDIRKVAIKSLAELPERPTIIEMECPSGGSHFIIGKRTGDKVNLIFDPAGTSNSWKSQKFISYREFVN